MRFSVGLCAVLSLVGCSSKGSALKQISGTAMSVCSLAESGGVTCWGNGGPGNVLGHGEPDYFPGARMPRRVVDLDDATQISVGLNSACAIRRDQSVSCWGIDWNTATSGRSSGVDRPKTIEGIRDVVDVSAGRSHVCAVTRPGEVYCWGDNGACQGGQPFTSIIAVIQAPARVGGIDDAIRVSAGEQSSCAIHKDGGVSCWGRMDSLPIESCEPGPGNIACVKALADGVLEAAARGKHVPIRVHGLSEVTQVAVGSAFLCALRSNGEILCAGANKLGELGQGHADAVPGLVKARVPSDAIQIAASDWSVCSVHASGEVWCWGARPQIPWQRAMDRGPAIVQGLPKAKQVALGSLHGCAACQAREVWCWGSGSSGETGRGAVKEPSVPMPVRL